jgi:copper chaperone
MATFKFKTNINCGGCIATVTPFLDGESDIQSWEVDTDNPNKILTVKSDSLKAKEIMKLVESAGFEIVEKKKGLFGKW